VEKATDTLVKGQMIGRFEILEVNNGTANQDGSGMTYELLLAAYETGKFTLPQSLSSTNAKTYDILVTEPPADVIKSYAPPKELLFPSEKEAATSWFLLLLTVLLAALAAWYLWKKQRTAPPKHIVINPNGLTMLKEIKAEWFGGKMESLALGEGLVNCMQVHYSIPIKKSSRQLINVIKKQQILTVNSPLETTLRLCDAWRFGKQVAGSQQGIEAIESIETLLHSFEPKKAIPS
jgi:hypothetical protein